jgi:hypothetical protein
VKNARERYSYRSMSSEERPLIVPVENQLREFDPKLLLSLVAAESGCSVYFGFRMEIDYRIGRPPGAFRSPTT